MWNGCSYKLQILCTDALWAIIAYESKIIPKCVGCHRIVKNSPRFNNAPSNENVKYHFCDTSHSGWPIVRCHPEQLCLFSQRGVASWHIEGTFYGRRLPANLMSARRVSSLSETVHLPLLGQSSGTVSLMTLHRPHRCQYSERNWKHTYFGNHIRTLFYSLLWFFVAIVVLEVNCYLGHVKNVM